MLFWIVIAILVLLAGLYELKQLKKLPAGDNVLTDAEALALDAGDAVEKEIEAVVIPPKPKPKTGAKAS